MYLKEANENIGAFLRKTKTEQLAVLLSTYLLLYFVYWGVDNYFPLSFALVFCMIAGILVARSAIYSAWFWVAAALTASLEIIQDWQHASNHDYVTLYVCALMTLVFLQPADQRERFIIRQAALVFGLVMLLAGLQKLFTPEYVNGSVFELMFLVGQVAPNLVGQEWLLAAEMKANEAMLLDFGRNFGENMHYKFEWHSALLHTIAPVIAWCIILGEVILGAVAFWFFEKLFFQIAVLVMVAGIFLIRPEGGFLSLLLILAWTGLPRKPQRIHVFYALSLLLILAFLIVKIARG